MLLEVTNFRSGAVLSHHDGKESENALTIRLEGIADAEARVTIDGTTAARLDKRFWGEAKLTQKINRVVVTASSQYGEISHTLTLVWDKKSYKRYNFYIDDHIFLFAELANERPAHAFDHFYLKALKSLHQRYGTLITLNCFYHNCHYPFDLDAMPDCYKGEFEDNVDWLKFSFHAYAEFPDRPYQHASAEKLGADFDAVKKEIVRFAGEKSFIPPVGIHWGMVHPDAFGALHERGVRMLDGDFLCCRVSLDEKDHSARVGDVGYYYEKDVTEYVCARKVFYDRFADHFLSRCDVTINLIPLAQIRTEVEKAVKGSACPDLLDLSSHEQYSFPSYFNYLPDHLQRLDECCKCAAELGYSPAFFAQGIFGNTAWDKYEIKSKPAQ